MKFRRIISVLTVISLLFVYADISALASAKDKKANDRDYSDTSVFNFSEETEYTSVTDFTEAAPEETTHEIEEEKPAEPVTDPEDSPLQQYEEIKRQLLDEYKIVCALNKEDYTEASYANLEIQIDYVKNILENWEEYYTKAEQALDNLKKAFEALESYEKILYEAVKKGEEISPDWYTESSFKPFAEALEKGRAALKEGNITGSAAKAIIEEIQTAEKNLYNIKDNLMLAVFEAKKKYSLVFEENSMALFKSEIERIEKAVTDDITPEEVRKLTDDIIEANRLLKPVMGDTNVSGEITITDATALQRFIGHLDLNIEPTVSDVNYDGRINVRDVTLIQEFIAGMIDEFKKEPHLPDYNTEWNLVLVNYKYKIKNGYVPEMRIVDGRSIFTFDVRAADALEKMLKDCRAEGLEPIICSAYRTQSLQEQLFANKVAYYTNKGYSYNEAVELAKTSVAYPGTSEHQLGLAVDIVSLHYQILDEGQLKTKEQQWLMNNCWKYGFILRYPTGKQDITGVIFEPWHYRYVGEEAAKEITEKGITLEEYLGFV